MNPENLQAIFAMYVELNKLDGPITEGAFICTGTVIPIGVGLDKYVGDFVFTSEEKWVFEPVEIKDA